MGVGEGSTWELLSRPGCHLCDEMAEVLDAVLPAYGLYYAVRDVDSREDWKQRYGEVIPVLLRDGRAVAKVRTDLRTVKRLVRRRR